MKTRIEFRHLAQFVSACQNPTIAETARELDTAPSALSTALRGLEEELRIKLFFRKGSHLFPLPAAFWLFQRSIELLHAERQLRSALRRVGEATETVRIDLDLSFTIGQISKAVNRAIIEAGERHSELEVQIRFLSAETWLTEQGENRDSTLDTRDVTTIRIGYGEAADDGAVPLLEDPWYSVGLTESIDWRDDASVPLFLLEMRKPVTEAAFRYTTQKGLRERLRPLKAQPAELAELLIEFPHARFLMPRSMIADRLGLVRAHLDPLNPALVSWVQASLKGPKTPGARALMAAIHDRLAEPEANVVFQPELTMRQIHYFNLVQRCGGISAAARVANVTQPSISSQIQRLETTLGTTLLERRRNGVVSTPDGQRLQPLTMALEEDLDQLVRSSRDIAAHTQSIVALGILPSSGHDSLMTEKIAEALDTLRGEHPDCRVTVVEAASGRMHDMVRSGELNLAIVTGAQARVVRIPLGRSEPLAVVANPVLALGGRSSISLREVCALPLVLGPNRLSIHQSFLEEVEAARLRVAPAMEVESLPLVIAMARRAALCTILPPSSVREDVRTGRLTATPIAGASLSGQLSVIFSGARSLSEGERSVIRTLLSVFGAASA